ncbi:MAG: uroporphyrinogen-III C-methyltransferase [Geminicoccaceae bacterium]
MPWEHVDRMPLRWPETDLPSFEPGWVWLVGSGPGDPGLLTVHAVNAINQADVIVYDALVNHAILALAPPGCVIEFAGKRGGKPSAQQRDITFRLIELARKEKRVLRLKGGDPFVFGRGGEEALALVEAQIPFRVVPGISAGVGALAYAGIPLTHRDTNQSVTFLTGHDAQGVVPSAVDWSALAKGSQVIVMYMALKHHKTIVAKLLDAGRSPHESVAIIRNGTLSNQEVVETTLEGLPSTVSEHDIRPPAIIVVGPIVHFRGALDWIGMMAGKSPNFDLLRTRRQADVG